MDDRYSDEDYARRQAELAMDEAVAERAAYEKERAMAPVEGAHDERAGEPPF